MKIKKRPFLVDGSEIPAKAAVTGASRVSGSSKFSCPCISCNSAFLHTALSGLHAASWSLSTSMASGRTGSQAAADRITGRHQLKTSVSPLVGHLYSDRRNQLEEFQSKREMKQPRPAMPMSICLTHALATSAVAELWAPQMRVWIREVALAEVGLPRFLLSPSSAQFHGQTWDLQAPSI